MKIQTFTAAGKQFNEDIMFCCENYGFVLDGATGVLGQKFTNADSDAKWFSNTIAKYLIYNLPNLSWSLSKVLKQAIIETKKEYTKFNNSQQVKDFPSCCCAMFRINKQKIEYILLGDCAIIYKQTNGTIDVLRPQDNINLDKTNLQILKQISIQQKKSVLECRPQIQEYIVKGRLSKNTPNGYWIVSDKPNAVNHAIKGSFYLKDIDSLAIMSDGYSQIFDTFNYYNEKSFYNALQKYGVKKIYDKLFKLQNKDKNCNKHPRFKVRDDATIIYIQR